MRYQENSCLIGMIKIRTNASKSCMHACKIEVSACAPSVVDLSPHQLHPHPSTLCPMLGCHFRFRCIAKLPVDQHHWPSGRVEYFDACIRMVASLLHTSWCCYIPGPAVAKCLHIHSRMDSALLPRPSSACFWWGPHSWTSSHEVDESHKKIGWFIHL